MQLRGQDARKPGHNGRSAWRELWHLPHAMSKIAYELAFLWLGESYFDDPLAQELRASIATRDPAAMDRFFIADKFISHWAPHEAHHLAYAHLNMIANRLLIAIRIFDLLEATVEVRPGSQSVIFRVRPTMKNYGFSPSTRSAASPMNRLSRQKSVVASGCVGPPPGRIPCRHSRTASLLRGGWR